MSEGQPPSGVSVQIRTALKDSALWLGAGLSVLLFFSISLVPIMGIFLGSFTPAPLVYHYYRRGRVFGLTATAAAVLTVNLGYLFAGHPLGGVVFFEYALVGVALGEAFGRGLSPAKAIGYAAGAALSLALLIMTISGAGQGQGPLSFARSVIEQQIRDSIQLYDVLLEQNATQSPAPGQPDSTEPGQPSREGLSSGQPVSPAPLNEGMEKLVQALVMIFPGLMVMGTVIVVWVNFLAARLAILRSGGKLPPSLIDLTRWQSPEIIVWGLIACGFAAFLAGGWIRTVGINGLMALGLLYFFQGLCVVAYWLDKKNVPPLLRAAIYTFIAIQQYLAIVIAALGLFDLWVDFRKLKTAGEGPEA